MKIFSYNIAYMILKVTKVLFACFSFEAALLFVKNLVT